MMQCNAVGDGLLSFIYSAVVCIGGWGVCTEITVPGNISQWSGIQSSAVWHFSTDCWPAVSGVAHPYYLLPGSELNINQESFIKLRKVMLQHQSHSVLRKSKLFSCKNFYQSYKIDFFKHKNNCAWKFYISVKLLILIRKQSVFKC